MSNLSDAYEVTVAEYLVGKTAATLPSVWVALFTAAPSDAGGGTEVSGSSYARVATTGASWTSANATTGVISNAAALAFPTATGSSYTVTHVALMNSASGTAGSNYIASGALTASKTINVGDTPNFPIGSLTLTVA
jgi:hypothetical protein